jgi:general stress protein YciG
MANEKQSGGSSERGGSGNFANDPQRASEAGKKGGQHSHERSQQDQGSSHAGSQSGSRV